MSSAELSTFFISPHSLLRCYTRSAGEAVAFPFWQHCSIKAKQENHGGGGNDHLLAPSEGLQGLVRPDCASPSHNTLSSPTEVMEGRATGQGQSQQHCLTFIYSRYRSYTAKDLLKWFEATFGDGRNLLYGAWLQLADGDLGLLFSFCRTLSPRVRAGWWMRVICTRSCGKTVSAKVEKHFSTCST